MPHRSTSEKSFTLWFIFLFLLFAQTAIGQHKGTVSGVIVEETTRQPAASATVRLLQSADSVLVAGRASAKNGTFSMQAPAGNYILHVSFIGFEDDFRTVSVPTGNSRVKTDTIFLKETSVLLDAAVVEAKIPRIAVRGDTIEYNAEAFVPDEHAMIGDLLRNIPGVNIQADGKITVNGKEIRKIYLDGKEFFSDDPEMLTQNLPAHMINKVQVYTYESEREKMTGFKDAETDEKVINLTVKEELRKSWVGNASLGYGNHGRYDLNAMLNRMAGDNRYTFVGGSNNTGNPFGGSEFGGMFLGGMDSGVERNRNAGMNFNATLSEKAEMSGDVSTNNNRQELIQTTRTENILADGNTFNHRESSGINQTTNSGINTRVEWRPDTLTNLSVYASLGQNRNHSQNTSAYSLFEAAGDTINRGSTSGHTSGTSYSATGSFMASRRLSARGRSINTAFQTSATSGNTRGNSQSVTHYAKLQNSETLDQQQTGKNSTAYFNGFVSYVEPIGKQMYLEASYSFNINNSHSDTDARNIDAEGRYTVLDKRYSRTYDNQNKRHDAALQFRLAREKVTFQTGVRIRPNSYVRESWVKDSLLNRQQHRATEYASDAYFSYRINQRQNISVRYNGYTQQPTAEQLSAVPETQNPLYLVYGNPNLKAAFSSNAGIDFNAYNPEKQRYMNVSLSFFNTANQIAVSNFLDRETGRQETTYENVNGNWNTTLGVTFNTPLKNDKYALASATGIRYNNARSFVNKELNTGKSFNIDQTLRLIYNAEKLNFDTGGTIWYNTVRNSVQNQQNQEFTSWWLFARAIWRLPKDFSLMSDVSYAGNHGYSRDFNQNQVLWNASVSKNFLRKKNANLAFAIYDILRQKTNISHQVTPYSIQESASNSLTGYFMVRFTYRFNSFGSKSENP